MSLRNAISGVIAGVGICMLLPALFAVDWPGSALGAGTAKAGLSVASREAGVKHGNARRLKKAGRAATGAPDQYLRVEFSSPTIRIEPAGVADPSRLPSTAQIEAEQAAPLHGYGSFEGVVIVPPAMQGTGVVLVEPAATTAPAGESVEDSQIPKDLSETEEDPWESFNRGIFALNDMLDHLVLEPTARIYHAVLPPPVRQGISNAVRNIGSPVTLANDILQGNRQRASDTIVRFMVNSTIGIGGLVDAAGYMGVSYHSEDFGQTLAVWGAGPGPYMVLPILGPSNPRDTAGKLVDTAINPLTWILFDAPLEERLAPSAVELVSGREAILDDYATLRKTSPDLYASVRDIYGQMRQTEISNGDVTGEPIPGVTSLPPSSMMTTVKPF